MTKNGIVCVEGVQQGGQHDPCPECGAYGFQKCLKRKKKRERERAKKIADRVEAAAELRK